MNRQKINRRENEHQRSNRIYLIYVVIAICMLTLVGGLAMKQLIQKEVYAAAEERQNYRRIILPGPRGNIYDRHGKSLVMNRPFFTAAVYLNELRSAFRDEYFRIVREQRDLGLNPDRYEMNIRARKNVVQEYQSELNKLLNRNDTVESTNIERHFSQSLLLPFPLIEDLTGDEYAILLENLRLDSPIQILASAARTYPYKDAAAHTLGFVSKSTEFEVKDIPGEDLLTFRFEGKIGRTGIERSFNDRLQGEAGAEIWTVDPSGFQYERVVYEPPAKGKDITTSLDIELQQIAEAGLGNKTGAVVALEVATGEVLVLASKPSYDLNDLSPVLSFKVDQEIRESGAWLNRAIQGLYPPGSTFKLVTACAGLRAGLIDENTEIFCPGYYMVGKRRFHCHRHSGHGDETLTEAIRDSCNVFFYDRSIKMGVAAIAAEARRFHLDKPTGIELPAETHRMLVPDPAWKKERFYGEGWFDGDTANMSIGQGFLLLTPLQMATFVASIASESAFVQPTILHRESEVPNREPLDLSPEAIALVKEGMRLAGERGTARLAGSPSIEVAGKTGTAQIRKDGKPTTLAWFVGYAPVQNPRIAIAVLVEGIPEEETDYGGGSTAAPIARPIFERFLQPETAGESAR